MVQSVLELHCNSSGARKLVSTDSAPLTELIPVATPGIIVCHCQKLLRIQYFKVETFDLDHVANRRLVGLSKGVLFWEFGT
jgi:hypothetical protein